MLIHNSPESLPQDKVDRLQRWLTQPESSLLLEQIIALAVEKTIEAGGHLQKATENVGSALEEAKFAASEAVKYEQMLTLLREIASGHTEDGKPYEYKRPKVITEKI